MTPPIPTPPLEGVVFFFLSLQAYDDAHLSHCPCPPLSRGCGVVFLFLQAYDEPTYLIVHAHPSLEGVVL